VSLFLYESGTCFRLENDEKGGMEKMKGAQVEARMRLTATHFCGSSGN